MRIENHYEFPVDTEWAFADGKFFITQSRPITTLTQKKAKQIHFVKTYTRDYSIIIEQAWLHFIEQDIKKFGWESPHSYPTIFYINDGTIEIWENEAALEWLIGRLLEENKAGSTFFNTAIERYQVQLNSLKLYWGKGFTADVEELSCMINLIFESMAGFFVMYFSSIDQRTPLYIKEKANALREQDSYFGSNTTFIRKSLIALYPELEGYEATILRNEIKNPPSKGVLKERKKHSIVYDISVVETVSLDEFAQKNPTFHFVIETPPVDSKEIIQGSVGSAGYAKGVVRILKRRDQISSVVDGEIVVSPMTTPDFLPAMQKGAAIITDEGGIMCHAAIVAREMGKPCIIGTKFATRVLHDGDMVEVDADNGIVRIIKRG